MKHADPLVDAALRDLDATFDADREIRDDVRHAEELTATASRRAAQPEVLTDLEDDASLPGDLQLLRNMAYTLDAAVKIPFLRVRIGLDPLLGLVPGVGDLVALAMGSTLVVSAWRHRVPGRVIARMIANVVIDGAIGAVPVVGDLLDVFSKKNLANLELLLRHREKRLPPRTLRLTTGDPTTTT